MIAAFSIPHTVLMGPNRSKQFGCPQHGNQSCLGLFNMAPLHSVYQQQCRKQRPSRRRHSMHNPYWPHFERTFVIVEMGSQIWVMDLLTELVHFVQEENGGFFGKASVSQDSLEQHSTVVHSVLQQKSNKNKAIGCTSVQGTQPVIIFWFLFWEKKGRRGREWKRKR